MHLDFILPSGSTVKFELTKHWSLTCIFPYNGLVNLCSIEIVLKIKCFSTLYIVTVPCRFLLSVVYLLKIFGFNRTVVCFISALLLVVLNVTCINLTVNFYITTKFFKFCECFLTTELLYISPWKYSNFKGVPFTTVLILWILHVSSSYHFYRFNTFSSSYIVILF